MQIDTYNTTKNIRKFLSVPAGTDLKGLKFPPTIDQDFREVVVFRKGITIEAGQPLIGMDPDEIIRQIQQRGYALHAAKIESKTGTDAK